MIDARELRIGNIIQDVHNGAISIVSSIQLMANNNYEVFSGVMTKASSRIEDLKGIPLTEEILLKCGFEFSKHYTAYTHNELCVEIKQNDGKGYWRIDPFSNKYDGKWYLTSEAEYTVSEKPIESLHQLQNLYFALTGEELEIKL